MQIKRSLLAISKRLRKTQTPWEDRLWHYLRGKRFQGYRFRRQFVIGPYIADFYCHKKRLVIEVDGSQHNKPENLIKDNQRTRYLTEEGYKVLRFWNTDLNNNFEGVLDNIYKTLNS